MKLTKEKEGCNLENIFIEKTKQILNSIDSPENRIKFIMDNIVKVKTQGTH